MNGAVGTPVEAAEPALYVDDARYARLWSLWNAALVSGAAGEVDSTGEISRLLYR